jgi:diazepam-binding inhibitor (GABA receptor modulator, acyl-CoA-binding protein)
MDLNPEFQEAVAKSKQLPNQSNEHLLKLYSLFKQATEGDVNIEKPANPFDMVGTAKFNAWDKLKGISKEEAMKEYIELVQSLGK